MTLSPQQITDQKAQRILKSALPPDWLVRDRLPDYRVDFVVEIFENEQSTGLEFAVQLKGTEKPIIRKSSVQFSVETEHLTYWVDKYHTPLFLVVIDVTEEAGWWIYIQKAVQERAIKDGWRDQKTVTVKIPVSNTLSDVVSLRKAVAAAVPYMSNLWPGAIRPTILAEKARLEELDPRLNIEINAKDDKINYVVSSKGEPVELTYTFYGADEDDFHTNVIVPLDNGDPIVLTPERMKVSGSKFFEHQLKGAATFQMQRLAETDVKIRIANGDCLVDSMKANLAAGMKNVQVNCYLSNGLLEISFISMPPEDVKGKASMSVSLRLQRYYGKEILTLPYFDQLFRFVKSAADGEKIVIEFWKEGNLGVAIPVTLPDPLILRKFADFLESVHRARLVARLLNLSPKMPNSVQSFSATDIDLLHTLMTAGEARLPGDKYQVSVEATNADELEEDLILGETEFPIGRKQFKVYDVDTDVDVEIILTDAIINRIDRHDEPGECTLICQGVTGSELVIRRRDSTELIAGWPRLLPQPGSTRGATATGLDL